MSLAQNKLSVVLTVWHGGTRPHTVYGLPFGAVPHKDLSACPYWPLVEDSPP
jgi:hypothetical protein